MKEDQRPHSKIFLSTRPKEEAAIAVSLFEKLRNLESENNKSFDIDEGEHGEQHGWIESLILYQLGSYVISTKAGRVYPGDVPFVLDGEPSNIFVMCEPDVSFVAQARVTPTEGFIYGAPDLAIEIISSSQTYLEVFDLLDKYFRYGTKQVWLVIPDKQQIVVHMLDGKSTKYSVAQTIPGGDLLPGFTLDIATVFEK